MVILKILQRVARLATRPFLHSLLLGAAILISSHENSAAQQPAFEPRMEQPEEFPDFPGRETTFYTCVACHNFKLVSQQGMSRPRWDSIINLMTDRHGMPKLEDKQREEILNYLEKAFPESDAPTGWQNPFMKQ